MARRGRVFSRDGKRGKVWYYAVDIAPPGALDRRQLKKGGFRTKGDAQRALNEVLVETARGTFVEPKRMTLGEYLTDWHSGLATRGLSETTVESYERNINNHIRPRLMWSVQLQDVKAADFDRLWSDLRQRGNYRTGGALSNRSIRYLYNVMTKALGDALKRGLVTRNEALLSNPPAPKTAKAPEFPIWDKDELRIFLKAAQRHPLYPCLRLAAYTGMRRGELLGLRWCDVDWVNRLVIVRGAVRTSKEHGTFRAPYPKTKYGERHVDLDDRTLRVLQAHRDLTDGADLSPIFPGPDGAWMPGKNLSHAFETVRDLAGVPRIRFHDLRHTHASHLIEDGVNVKLVQERLGHASSAFTMDRYVHVLPQSRRRAIDSFTQRIEFGNEDE